MLNARPNSEKNVTSDHHRAGTCTKKEYPKSLLPKNTKKKHNYTFYPLYNRRVFSAKYYQHEGEQRGKGYFGKGKYILVKEVRKEGDV